MSDSASTLDNKWFDFTSAYVEKLNAAGGSDWSILTPEEQELAALWKLEMDMYNGGFVQFFCNWERQNGRTVGYSKVFNRGRTGGDRRVRRSLLGQ